MKPHHPLSALILLGGLCLSLAAALRAEEAAGPVVIVAEAREEGFSEAIEALGTLRANESVVLTATVTETIRALHFDDGDRVEAGQLLVELERGEEQAQLTEARATLEEAHRQYRRVESLEARDKASRSLLDERRREWETARARVTAIESRLADRMIRAPFAGVLGLRDISVGDLVTPGDPLVTLDDDAVMKLEFTVPATFLAVVEPGLAIEATSPAWPGETFTGEIKAVDSRIDPTTRAVRVRALLPNPGHRLKPGLLMQVEIRRPDRRALFIPEEALMPQGERQFVLRVDRTDNNKVVRQEVGIDARRPGQVEITAGLAPGDAVITHGTQKARPGQPVRIGAVDDGSRPLAQLLQSLGTDGSDG